MTMTEKYLKLVNGMDNPIGGLMKPLMFCGWETLFYFKDLLTLNQLYAK